MMDTGTTVGRASQLAVLCHNIEDICFPGSRIRSRSLLLFTWELDIFSLAQECYICSSEIYYVFHSIQHAKKGKGALSEPCDNIDLAIILMINVDKVAS